MSERAVLLLVKKKLIQKMSRGIKDLRELICVSRLSIRDSDDEYPLSNSDDEGMTQPVHYGSRNGSSCGSRQSSASSRHSPTNVDPKSPDSGFGTNGHSQSPILEGAIGGGELDTPLADLSTVNIPRSAAARKRRRRKKKSKNSWLGDESHGDTTSTMLTSSIRRPLMPLGNARINPASGKEGDFDDLLTYLDATLVSQWLVEANRQVTDIATWCYKGDNFVQFAHFWLMDFSATKQQEIFQLEYSIVLDHLTVAFAAGRQAGKIKQRDIVHFLLAVLKEYPSKLLASVGAYMFLDYLDVLSSERRDTYRRLLANVRCTTQVKQYAQWTLAIRSFALVSMWHAVLNFYRGLLSDTSVLTRVLPVPMAVISKTDPYPQRMYHAVRLVSLFILNSCIIYCVLAKFTGVFVCKRLCIVLSPRREIHHLHKLIYPLVNHDFTSSYYIM